MVNKLTVSPSPHIKSAFSTASLMRDVVIALIPSLLASFLFFGWSAVIVTATTVASCLLFEYIIVRVFLKRSNTINDFSALVTGVLLALNLPPTASIGLIVLGSFVAIAIAKMSFGGLGNNPFNPALVARVFLLISFAAQMSDFEPTLFASSADALSGATPLAFAKESLHKGVASADIMQNFSYFSMLLGNKAGSIGEVSILALLIGFAYLLYRKVITWHIPVCIVATVFCFSGILHLVDPKTYISPMFHLLSGGLFLGAIFMATDYVTSPMNKKGAIIYAIGIGAITVIIRAWGPYPEGISFAILIMNGVVPILNKYTRPKRYGDKQKTK